MRLFGESTAVETPTHFKTSRTSNESRGSDHCNSRQFLYAHPTHPFSSPNTAIMSDAGEVEVESQQISTILPKDVASEIGSIKLFNKWSYEDVEIRDISLTYDHLFP